MICCKHLNGNISFFRSDLTSLCILVFKSALFGHFPRPTFLFKHSILIIFQNVHFWGLNWVRGAWYGIFFIHEKPALRAGLISKLSTTILIRLSQFVFPLEKKIAPISRIPVCIFCIVNVLYDHDSNYIIWLHDIRRCSQTNIKFQDIYWTILMNLNGQKIQY